MAISEDAQRRAVLLSNLAGVTRGEVCARFGVSKAELVRLRKSVFVYPSPKDLVLAALSDCGRVSEGSVGPLEDIARYVDWQNRDGTTAEQVRVLLDAMAAEGLLVLDGDRWRLTRAWP